MSSQATVVNWLAIAMPLSATAAGDKAQSPSAASPSAERTFDTMDKNKDGSLSRDEMKGAAHEKDFAKLDKNSDGKLSRQEYGDDRAATGATSGSAGSSGAAGSTPPRSGGAPAK